MRKILIAIVLTVAVSACKGPGRQESDKRIGADVNAEIAIDEPAENSEAKSTDVVLAAPPQPVDQVKFAPLVVKTDGEVKASRVEKKSSKKARYGLKVKMLVLLVKLFMLL